jgi:hypothetical protein
LNIVYECRYYFQTWRNEKVLIIRRYIYIDLEDIKLLNYYLVLWVK